ncbi:MAG: thymidylate synthase [Desulfobacterales bacterium]|nr:thymidylate synthase [Desulfobacterales bacterium]
MVQEYFSSESVCGINAAMEFIPLHFADRLTVINPQGTIGVVTLWSKVDYVIERFRQAGVDLNPATSPIAVFGTLYGNGLREMLRNLLYNPQIQTLLICGHDRSGSREELEKFFELGIELVERALVRYKSPMPGVEVKAGRIRETKRMIDDLVQLEQFKNHPELILIGDPQQGEILNNLRNFFSSRLQLPKNVLPRQEVPLPEVEIEHFPSNPRAHQIIRDTPLEAWKELIYLFTRFGRLVTLSKGNRLELQNIKVVVEKPEFETKEKLLAYNFDPDKLRKYQEEILRPERLMDEWSIKGQKTLFHIVRVELRQDETYSYGHRLREYFNIDGLLECALRLKKDPEDRKAYFTLWHNKRDLLKKEGHPCFVSLFFRKFEEKLTLTATFRTHNAMDGWLLNCYGLMAIQNFVAEQIELPVGAITVFSHSISLDPRELDRAMAVVGKRSRSKVFRLDPMGYFRITLDGKEILVEHRFEDVTLREYRGKTAVSLQYQIARDVALSDINHAIYLGRQLAKAEMALKDGREFVQD